MLELLGERLAHTAGIPFDRPPSHLSDDELMRNFMGMAVELRRRGLDQPALLGQGLPIEDLNSVILDPESASLNDPEDALDLKQKDRLEQIRYTLSEKFSNRNEDVTPKDFGLVPVVQRDGSTVPYVLFVRPESLYRGSPKNIMSGSARNITAWTIELDGQQVDTRRAMTRRTHRAMCYHSLVRYLADAGTGFSGKTSFDPPSATWLTGQPAMTFDPATGRLTRPDKKRALFAVDTQLQADAVPKDKTSDIPSFGTRPGLAAPELAVT